MRKRKRAIWVAVGVIGLAGVGAIGSAAYARDTARSQCPRHTLSAAGSSTVDARGRSSVLVCDGGTSGADAGVSAGADTTSGQGYAVYQGRPGDTIPAGYVGADTQNGLTIVGCDTGTYDPNAPDEWNQRPNSPNNNAQIAAGTDEFTAPTGPIGPGDPCSPFVPHTPPGRSCGSPQDPSPDTTYPGAPSPLNVYSSGAPTGSGDVGIAGDFGGGQGASGILQATYDTGGPAPTGNITTGGNSRGGGGTVAVGNDGNETDDPFTPAGSPVVLCQN